jgi:hypothetical protein
MRAALSWPALAAAHLVALAAAPTARADPDDSWHVTAQVGTTAMAANRVMPLPAAIGVGAVVERGWFGVEGSVHLDVATDCDQQPGGDGYCGLLRLWELGVRFTPLASHPWSPYAALRFTIADSSFDGTVPAVGPRLGLRYRGARLGFYLEGGESLVPAANGRFGAFLSERRWFPQISAGLSIAIL